MQRLYYILILLFIGAFTQYSHAQRAGYYGKKVFFSIGSELAPSFSSYRQVKDGQFKRNPKIIYSSFNASMEAIVGRRMTLNVRYTFDPIYSQTGGGNIDINENYVYSGQNSIQPIYYLDQAYLMDDFWSYRHDIGLDFKLYLRDNIPAIGKFFKFGASYSLIQTPEQSYNLYANNVLSNGPLYNETRDEILVTGGTNSFHVIFLKVGYGQSFELARNIFFYYSLNFNFPLFDTNAGAGPDTYTGKNLFGRETTTGYNASKVGPDEYRINDNRYYDGISRSVMKQNLLMLELGFSFALF